ncbi:Prolyl 4-hydroxylase subunit alpha-1 [Trichoplax sp. H2]|nr:Prolyl 4-hydroxylase subunit alpha-1 [Trichoplax sp. H2]|eukprot:RDD42813.1 Prolyl 4-hydroxylase subunit alpha-1 [Trichoplax sp. H2]
MAVESTRGSRAAGKRISTRRSRLDGDRSRPGIVTKKTNYFNTPITPAEMEFTEKAKKFYVGVIVFCISLMVILVLFVAKPTEPDYTSKDWFMPKRRSILAMASEVIDKKEGDGYSVSDMNLQEIDEKEGTNKPAVNWSAVPDEIKNFKSKKIRKITMKNIYLDSKRKVYKEIKHKNKKSHVKIYTIDAFLSDKECDGLIGAHNRYVSKFNKQDPIMCFDAISTLRSHLKDAKLKMQVTPNVFTEGTTCLNASFSSLLKKHLRWSYSTAFYNGESPFATRFAERIEAATGLPQSHGGKFQITSYPTSINYKAHTDCMTATKEKRDRYATVLVYLTDVSKGGYTNFTELNVPVVPAKGKALIWNNMDKGGNCDPTSIHAASEVVRGFKYIIQRWYYYENFYALGKRLKEPELPDRKPEQPRVTCDEYQYGSCRWYDEWNYEHLLAYRESANKL